MLLHEVVTYDLCIRYGLGEAERAERLELVGLAASDHRWANILRERVVRPHLRSVIAHTRAVMRHKKTVGRWVLDAATFAHVHRMHAQALQSLGADFDTQGYFEARLHVAVGCYSEGLPASVCVYVQHAQLEALMERLPREHRSDLVDVLLKLAALDSSLTALVYETELRREAYRARAAERTTRRRAGRDSVTGITNRSSMEQHLQAAFDAAQQRNLPLSVLAIDIDHFKDVNDQYGHPVGDGVLRRITSRMESALREGDWIGRYGGDEFLVVLRRTRAQAAAEVAERVRARVADDEQEVNGKLIDLTISIGVAEMIRGETPDDLVGRADSALYSAKRGGRNRVVLAGANGHRPKRHPAMSAHTG